MDLSHSTVVIRYQSTGHRTILRIIGGINSFLLLPSIPDSVKWIIRRSGLLSFPWIFHASRGVTRISSCIIDPLGRSTFQYKHWCMRDDVARRNFTRQFPLREWETSKPPIKESFTSLQMVTTISPTDPPGGNSSLRHFSRSYYCRF